MSEKVVSYNRRLLVYILVDCSESMAGEPIEIVRSGLKTLMLGLTSGPLAPENAWVSVITFANEATELIPLTRVGDFREPTFHVSGDACLGAGLRLLTKRIDANVRKTTAEQKGDFKPIVFIFTNGHPTDNWEEPADELERKKSGKIIGCVTGTAANEDVLKHITEDVIRLQEKSPGTLDKHLGWGPPPATTWTSPELSPDLPPLPEGKDIRIVP